MTKIVTVFFLLVVLTTSFAPRETNTSKYIVVYEKVYCLDCINDVISLLNQKLKTKFGESFQQGIIGRDQMISDSLSYYDIQYKHPTIPAVILPSSLRSKFEAKNKKPVLIHINYNNNSSDTTIFYHTDLFDTEGLLKRKYLLSIIKQNRKSDV